MANAQDSVEDLFGADALGDEAIEESPSEAVVNESEDDGASTEASEKAPGSAEELFGIENPSVPDTPSTEADASVSAATDEPGTIQTDEPAVKLSGFWQNELAFTYVGESHFSKWRNIGRLVAKGEFTPNVKWQVSGHLIYDPVFELDDFYQDRVEDNQKLDGYFHETFVSISSGNWEWTLGRQNIVWGEAVGLFFADVVSALDLREFVLPDFELIRIPQWAIRSEYFGDDLHAELLYIPMITTEEIGEFGAEYFPFPVRAPAGFGVTVLDEQEPGKFGRDFAAGGRISYLKNGWDAALFYYTSPDRSAAFSREVSLSPSPQLIFRGIHERIHQIGSTLAKDIGPTILKVEAVYTKDRLMSVGDPIDLNGLDETDEFRYLIGLDWVIGEHTLNAQLFQTWFQDHQATMALDELESGISLYAKTTGIHPDIEPELLWIRSLNRNEWLLEAKVSWKFQPDWRLAVGADIFEGPASGILGRFDETDRVYTEIRFSF